MRYLLSILVLLLATPAHAADAWWLNFGGPSYHTRPGYNGQNWGVGLQHDIDAQEMVVAGVYRNSYYRTTHYLAYGRRTWKHGSVSAGFVVGLIDGYPALNRGRVIPWSAPFVTVEGDVVGLNFIVVPAVEKQGAWALAAQVKVRVP